MNDKKTMQPITETNSLKNIIFDEVHQKISNTIIDAENVSKEKYATKEKLIESANDMTTQEKLDAIDKNYDRRNQERWQNMLYYAMISFSMVGIVLSNPVAIKNVRKLLNTA